VTLTLTFHIFWDGAHLSRLADDTVYVPEFDAEYAGVMELDAVVEVYILFHQG
jgi:hypothetical protein